MTPLIAIARPWPIFIRAYMTSSMLKKTGRGPLPHGRGSVTAAFLSRAREQAVSDPFSILLVSTSVQLVRKRY